MMKTTGYTIIAQHKVFWMILTERFDFSSLASIKGLWRYTGENL